MDEPPAQNRAERSFWAVWNYISAAVTRFLRSEPGQNNPGNADPGNTVNADQGNADPGNADPGNTVNADQSNADPGNADPGNADQGNLGNADPGNADQGNLGNADPGNADQGNLGNADPGNADQGQTVDRQTGGFGRAESDPSQRDEEEEEEEKKKEDEEQSNLTTASLPHSPQPPIALPPPEALLLLDPPCTDALLLLDPPCTDALLLLDPPCTDALLLLDPGSREVQCMAGSTRWSGLHSTPEEEETQPEQLIQTEGERTEGRSCETRTEEPDKRQHQQDTELSKYTDEDNGHHHSGLGEEIEKTPTADGPEDEADQNSQVTEEEEEEARVRLSGDEEPDLNEPNNVSELETKGNDIVREENITCVNEENLERTEEGGGEGGETQKATSMNPENADGGSTEPSAHNLSDDQTANHFKSSEAVWEPDFTGIVSDEDGKEKADLVMTCSDFLPLFVESPEPNLSSLVSNDDNTVVGQELLEVEAKQIAEEVKVEEKEHSSFLIEGSDDFYRKGSDVIDPVGNQEVVGIEEEMKEEGACGGVTVHVEERKENSVIPQMAQDKKNLLCFVDTGTHDTGDSLSTSSDDEDDDDGEGGVSTHWSVGIDSPGVALMVEVESNNEQEMSAELQDVSPGAFPGSGAGPRGLNCVPCEETRGLIPEVNNGHVAVAAENTEQRALMGRDSEERWVTSQLPHASGGFKYVAGLGEVDHSQREDRDTTLKSGERENTAAGPDMVVGGSVDPESLVDSGAPWGIEEQMSRRAEQATGQEGAAGRSDEEHSMHEAHKTDGEDFKTEEPLFEFTLDGERSESTGAAAEEAVASEDGVLSSMWYNNVAAQDDTVLCEEILILPDTAIQKTTEACEGQSTAAMMTEENNGRTLSQSEDYVEPQSIDQPIENQMKSFEDGQMEIEDIGADISDVAMGKDVSTAGSEETTAESVQQRTAGQLNESTVETVGLGSLTDMTSDLLIEVRQDLPDELLESTSRVTEPQTETSTQEIIEHVEDVSAVKAAEDESALAFGQVTETDEEILAMWVETVLLEDTDHTPSDITETENQAVSRADTRTRSSSSSSSDDDPDDEAADKTSKTHETPNHQPDFVEQIRDPGELKEMSGQIKGEEDEELPPPLSYSGKSGLECEDSEHTSGGEGTPEREVLTTKPEGIRLSEMLMMAPPGVLDVSPHSFTEERPTHSTSPEQEPQHLHPPQSSGKLSDNEAVLSQGEQDELSYESRTNEETIVEVEAMQMNPEGSAVAKSSDGAADDGRDERSVIPVPIPNSEDEDCMKTGVEGPSHLPPSDMKLSEVDSVVLRERKGFGESRPLYKVSMMNQNQFRRSELIASSVPGLSREERAGQRHSLPPGTSGDQLELDVNVLDLTVQKSRILVKNPSVRPPTDPRALLQMPSLEPSQPSSPQRAPPLAGRPIGGLGVGIKLPGFGAGFPALKKTQKVVKEGGESVPEQKSEPQQGMTNISASTSPKPTVADHKPRWTPPKHPTLFGNPLMSELKSKLKKTSEE